MQKLLALFTSAICLLFVSTIYSNQFDNKYVYAETYGQYTGQEVVETPCVGKCSDSGNFYVGAFGGANWLNFHKEKTINLKTKLGYTGGISLGYSWNTGFRLEGEVAYRHNRLKAHYLDDLSLQKTLVSGHTHSWAYMVNGLYDFNGFSRYVPDVVPYAGLGIGYTRVSAHVKNHENKHDKAKATDKGVAYQAIAGVKYRCTDDTSLGVEYRYFDARKHARDQSVVIALTKAI